MRDFPSCFGENAVQIADSSSSTGSKTAQNLVACVYQCQLRGRSCLITLTWCKNLMSQGLSVGIGDSTNQSLCKVDIKPWLFSKRKGSKSVKLHDSTNIDIYWDFSSAKFGSGPEPLEGFCFAIASDRQTVLLLGDMKKEAFKKTAPTPMPGNAVFVARREHIFGKKVFYTKARFCDNGQTHDLMIECDTISTNDPCLIIRVNTKNVMQVKHLRWKFRGNHTILVDGLPVEVFWDVHNWLFGTSVGSAVFMFKTSMLHWSHSPRFRDSQSHPLGFSLILYVWNHE
ncbi:hypothetical protein Nepgr_015035 [Nepenthes gracilis]|uniref:Uncharacterized protein n=1 Tax=Nepenthes gracilis TaxID=150966 RepID=A0AAD3SLW3_NEPGR|nr:hypothetical protein Nepgr_015035 [Nepenthes gracilis]